MRSITARGLFAATLAASLTAPSYAQEARIELVSSIRADAEGQFASVRNGPTSIPVLRGTIAVDLDRASLEAALVDITRSAGIELTYSRELLPGEVRVTLQANSISVGDALDHILRGTGLDVLVSEEPKAVLVRRPEPPPEPTPAEPPAGTIVGRVTEAETGTPLINAQIAVDGRGRTITDADGGYRVEAVPAGRHTVTITLIGYASAMEDIEVADGATVTADFALELSAVRIDEVVVTATGEQRRRELGHVVGRVNAESVASTATVTSFTDVLNGRIAGVQVLPTNGLVGQAPRIRVRGISGATATNDAIVIVDGIRFEQSPNPAGQFPPSTRYGRLGGALADLNPDEIESIEVAKGPSAATLYGTDAANGVIIITTKRGEPGRARWHVYAEQGISTSPVEWPDNYFAWGRLTSTGEPTQCFLTLVAAGTCVQDSVTVTNPLTDPEISPLGTGHRQQLGLQVSGGTDAIRYFVGGEFENDLGVLRLPDAEIARLKEERQVTELPSAQIRPNQMRKGSLRANLTAILSDNADATVSTTVIRNNTRLPDINALLAPGNFGQGFSDSPDLFRRSFGGAPGDAFSEMSLQRNSRFVTSLGANWRVAPWLATRATIGGDFRSTFFDGLQPRGQGVTTLAGRGGRLNQRTNVDLYTADLSANATFGVSSRISSTTALGVQYTRRDFGQTTIDAQGLLVGSRSAAGAATIVSGEENVATVIAGSYLQQTFGLNDRLYLTGAVRGDGASAFGSGFQTAFYPKASASWVISEEPFLGRPEWLTSLRLRAAFGSTGTQPDPTAALLTAAPVSVFANGTAQSGAIFSTLGNPDLGPERQTELEAGIDLELFAGRLRLETTYYNRKSTDALINVPLSPSVGYGSRQENIGSVRNTGLEMELAARVIDGDRTALDVGLNGSSNRNRLLELAPGLTRLQITPVGTESREGYPLFSAWSRKLIGYEDANGDGIIGLDEVVLSDTAVFLGPQTPPRQASVWSTLSLFNNLLQVRTLFDYRGGHTVLGTSDRNRCIFSFRPCRGVNDPSAPLGEQANAVAASIIGFSFANAQKADFVRWKELSAQLNFPEGLAARVGARSARLTLGARNLALFTRSSFSSVDPEMAGVSGTDFPSSFPVVPPVRTWTVRVDLDY